MSEASPYDEVPYFSRPLEEASLDRLASVATLFGMQPAPPEGARVLELGCAGAGHLIPLASRFPHARFVGVDLAGEQLACGRERVAALGLTNVDLRHMSALDIDEDFGEFDYVIAHGFYSWVPEEVRAHTWRILRANLAPQGVGYVSFNTLPGWSFQRTLREMMRFHTREVRDPEARVTKSRTLLQFLMHESPPGTLYSAQLRTEGQLLLETPSYHLLHDHLGELNRPEYFHEFMAAARAHGLQYVGDSELWTMNTQRLTPQAREVVESIPDRVVREQYMDFLWRRSFRHTLLTHAAVTLDERLEPARLAPFVLRLAGRLQPAEPDPAGAAPLQLSTENVALEVADPVAKALLLTLQEHPQGVAYRDAHALAGERLGRQPSPAERAALDGFLLGNLLAGTLDLGLRRHPFRAAPGDTPRAAAFARLAAAEGDPSVANLCHRSVVLSELERRVLVLADGSRDAHALAEECGEEPARVREVLAALAHKALLEED